MDTRPAKAPDLSALADLAGELASTFVALSSDIALVIDSGGAVRQVVQGAAPLANAAEAWVGRPWAETVTGESQAKIEQLLRDVSVSGVSRAREVNLDSGDGTGIPVSYAAIRLGQGGPLLAVGRDLRAIASIQQRFTETQQEMERDYWKRRQTESRYRLLFQVATDAVLVVDALTMNILEANRAAAQMFGPATEPLVGRHAAVGIDTRSWPAVEELLNTTRGTGRPAEIRARLAEGGGLVDVSATSFRSDRDLLMLVRMRSVTERSRASNDASATPWAGLVQRTPDAVVITDSNGRVLMANPAFLDLVDATRDAQVEGRELAQWLGDNHATAALLGHVKRQGMATQGAAPLRSDGGRTLQVSLSAVLLDEGDRECIGFTLRRIESAGVKAAPAAEEVARSIEALGTLMGRRPLPELLHAASALIERHLIRSAMSRSGGDPSAAALLLGISQDVLAQRRSLHALDDAGLDAGLPANRIN